MPTSKDMSRKQLRALRKNRVLKRMVAVALMVGCFALIALGALVINRPSDGVSAPASQPSPSSAPDPGPSAPAEASLAPSTAPDSPAPTPAPTPVPAPSPTPYFLPVISQIGTEEKLLVITVDDCFRSKNVAAVLDIARDNGARITFFPIARALKNNPDIWTRVLDEGHEIENHSYTHYNMLRMSPEKVYQEITEQNKLLNRVLGKEYTFHFLRTPGGSARNDPEVHAAMKELGYYAMAHWAFSGSSTRVERTLGSLEPGQILLYHATNADLEKLKIVIPGAIEMGYKLVTLNELLGYPPNEIAEPASADAP